LSWLGIADLKAAGLISGNTSEPIGDGPILGALKNLSFDELHLLHDHNQQKATAYINWLAQFNSIKVASIPCSLRSPIDFGDIHHAVDGYLQKLTASNPNLDISIHLSPGTPSMTAVSILLGKTKYNTRFVQSTKDKGGEFVSIPFDISAEFVPQIAKHADKKTLRTVVSPSAAVGSFFRYRDAKSRFLTRHPKSRKNCSARCAGSHHGRIGYW